MLRKSSILLYIRRKRREKTNFIYTSKGNMCIELYPNHGWLNIDWLYHSVFHCFQIVQITFDFFELYGDIYIYDLFANHEIFCSPETTVSQHFDIGWFFKYFLYYQQYVSARSSVNLTKSIQQHKQWKHTKIMISK